MITNTLFGNQHLHQRLGNQLFQYASLVGIAHRFGTSFKLPFGWISAPYFQLEADIFMESPARPSLTLREASFCYSEEWLMPHAKCMQQATVNIQGFLQSEKYWIACKERVLQHLSFRPFVQRHARRLLAESGCHLPHTVAISVRRGDFATDPNHYLLGPDYYREAYRRFFEGYDVFFFSDDLAWCRTALGSMAPNAYYAQGMNAIEQLSLMQLFGNFIIANSTFSWWGAYLSATPEKKVIRPVRHFDGGCLELDISDHYPASWIPLDAG